MGYFISHFINVGRCCIKSAKNEIIAMDINFLHAIEEQSLIQIKQIVLQLIKAKKCAANLV